MGCCASSSHDDDTPNQFPQLRSVPEFQAERRALRRARQHQQQHHKSNTSSASASTSPGTSSLPRPTSPSGDATHRRTSECPAAVVQAPSGSQDVHSTAQHRDRSASTGTTGTTAVVPVAAPADADVQESTSILPAKAGVPFDFESSFDSSATTGHPLPPMERSPMTPVRTMSATSGAAGAVPKLPPMIGSRCLVADEDAQRHHHAVISSGGALASTEEEDDDDDTPPTWALTPTHYSGLGSARSWRTEMRLTTRTVSFVGEEDVVTPLARTSSILLLRQQQQQPTDAVCPTPPLRPAAPAAKPACPLLPLPHLPDVDDGDLPPTFLD